MNSSVLQLLQNAKAELKFTWRPEIEIAEFTLQKVKSKKQSLWKALPEFKRKAKDIKTRKPR